MPGTNEVDSLFAAARQSKPAVESSSGFIQDALNFVWGSPLALMLLGLFLMLIGFYMRHLVIKRIVKRRNPMGIEQYDSYASLAWNRRLNQFLYRSSTPAVGVGAFLICLGVFAPAREMVGEFVNAVFRFV